MGDTVGMTATDRTEEITMITKNEVLNRLIETASEDRLSNRKRIAALQAFKAVKAEMTRPELLAYAVANEATRKGVLVDESI